MGRNYTQVTLKKLWALSGNMCAFPGCNQVLVDINEIIIGEMAHIKGERPDSARYDSVMTEDQRNDYSNLILMCPTHHTTIDKDKANYPVKKLLDAKIKHEKTFKNNQYKIPDHLFNIINFSVNNDEYSLERAHNFLRLYTNLKGIKTTDAAYDHLKYVINGLKFTEPITHEHTYAIDAIFRDIDILKSKKKIYNELILLFLEKIPISIKGSFVSKLVPYIENEFQSTFDDRDVSRLYKILNKSDKSILDMLVTNANKYKTDIFASISSDLVDYKSLSESKEVFLEIERMLWEKLDDIEVNEGVESDHYKNVRLLVSKFINVNL